MGWELDPEVQRGQGYSQFLGICVGLSLPPCQLLTCCLHQGSRMFSPTHRHGTGFKVRECLCWAGIREGSLRRWVSFRARRHQPSTAQARLRVWAGTQRAWGAGRARSRWQVAGGQVQDRTFSIPPMGTLRPRRGRGGCRRERCVGGPAGLSSVMG